MADASAFATIATGLGQGALFLRRVTATERLSEPFTVTCEAVSASRADFTALIGSGVSVSVPGDGLTGRAFHGLLAEASVMDVARDGVTYRLVLRPWLWGLTLRRDCRIFQAMTAQAIVQQVLDASGNSSGYTNKASVAGKVARNYTVQYDESDFAFVSRIMEEEGLYYYFEHTADKHTMVICDGPSSHGAFAGGDLTLNREPQPGWIGPRLWGWGERVRAAPNSVTLRDSNQAKFGQTLQAQASGVAVGQLAAESYSYPGGYALLDDAGAVTGDNFAALRLQALRAEQLLYTGEGDTFAVPVGSTLTVAPVDTANDAEVEILVVGAIHSYSGQSDRATGEGEREERTLHFEAIPSTAAWKPRLVTPKPVARGPQVATVVGGSGDVIDPDQYGRVKVQFPWDRVGTNDEGSSCWVRVSQGWADNGFGQVHLPRIGEEVIVSFLDGDMDRPVITGRVYNATNMPPYALPDNKTQSGWKSQTVGDSGQYPDTVNPPQSTPKGSNELRFEDKGGSEEVYLHAQRLFTAWYRFDETRTTGHNTTVSVGYNRTVTVKNDESKTVQEGNETHTVSQGNLTTAVSQGDESHTVGQGKRTTSIQGDESLTVQSGKLATTVSQGDETHEVSAGKRTTTVFGNDGLTVSTGNWTRTISAGSASMTSPQEITFTVGPSSIQVTPEGITLSAPMITLNGTAKVSVSAPMVQVSGEAMVQVEGALVTIN